MTEDSHRENFIHLTPALLWDLGFKHLTRSEVTDLLDEIYDTLEFRAGAALSEGLDRNQLAHFERIVNAADDAQASKWLETNVPSHRAIVRAEYEHIIGTLRQANARHKTTDDGDRQIESSKAEA